MFRALLTGPMREGQGGHQGHALDPSSPGRAGGGGAGGGAAGGVAAGQVEVLDVRAPVFRALLHFAYTDTLPDELLVRVGTGVGVVGGELRPGRYAWLRGAS